MITCTNVTFGYTDRPVLEGIDCTIEAGEFLGIIGPNGSGKSTLLELILGLHTPDSGDIYLFDSSPRAFTERERIGYVAQDEVDATGAMPITVEEVVLMGRFPRAGFGRIDGDDRARARDAMETAGIADLANERVATLSGGQRQRAFIARALAGDADLLVLDEPTVGVDAESVEAFLTLLDELNANGMTIVLVEHDISAVLEHADRLICLNREVYFDGDPASFAESEALERAYGSHLHLDAAGNTA